MKNEQVVSVLHKDKRIQVFFELKKPSTKKDIQVFCGMLASLQSWNLNLPMNILMLRKAAGPRGKVAWNEELEAEYQAVIKIMQNQIRLIPYNPTKKLRLVIDGAKTVGTGFLLIQYINDKKPERGINIINAGSGLLPDDKDYSRVKLRQLHWNEPLPDAITGSTTMKMSVRFSHALL